VSGVHPSSSFLIVSVGPPSCFGGPTDGQTVPGAWESGVRSLKTFSPPRLPRGQVVLPTKLAEVPATLVDRENMFCGPRHHFFVPPCSNPPCPPLCCCSAHIAKLRGLFFVFLSGDLSFFSLLWMSISCPSGISGLFEPRAGAPPVLAFFAFPARAFYEEAIPLRRPWPLGHMALPPRAFDQFEVFGALVLIDLYLVFR